MCPVLVTNRVTQWREMISESTQKIGRPRQLYTGPTLREVPPLRARRPSFDISLLGSTKSESNLSVTSPVLSPSISEDNLVFFNEGEDEEGIMGGEDSCNGSKAKSTPKKAVQKAKFHRPN